MRIRSAVPVGLCCLLTALSLGAKKGPKDPVAGKDQQPPLPDGVKKTVDEHFPGQQILGYEHEADEKRQLFFVDIKTDKGPVTLLSSGKGVYLGMVSDAPDDDDTDVYIEYDTAPQTVKDAIVKHLTKGLDAKASVTVNSLFMEVEGARFMYVAEIGGGEATTQPKAAKGPAAGATWWTFAIGGSLVSVEKEVAIKNLPAPVADSLKDRKILSANIVDDKEKKTTSYVVDVGGAGGGSDQELTLSPDGKILSTEAVESDTPKP